MRAQHAAVVDTPLQPSGAGVLVVSDIIPGGAAAKAALQPGDVLVRLGGRLVTTFVPLEELLDDAVGQPIELEFERGGERRAQSHCRFVLPLIRFTPDLLRESVLLLLKRQCHRTLGERMQAVLEVDDLHALCPRSYLSVGGGPRQRPL